MISLQELIEFHRKLVSISSVNPEYGGAGEAPLVDFLVEEAARRGFTLHRQQVFPGRDNLYARLGDPNKPALLLDAHLDTVAEPPNGMEIPGREEADKQQRTYGRGSCDTKAALAVFFQVFSDFAQNPDTLPFPLVFGATIDEECRQTGAFRLMEVVGPLAGAIAGEPTQGNIIHTHKGSYRSEWQTLGKSSHSSMPHLGDNAIYRMADAIIRLRALANELSKRPADPHLGNGTLNVGIIKGGAGANIVPDLCTIFVDRRILPGEDPDEVVREMDLTISGGDTTHFRKVEQRIRTGIYLDSNHPFAANLGASSAAIKGDCEFLKAPYMTNATAFSQAGVPSVVFGPGCIEHAHTKDEYLDWSELDKVYRILNHFILEGSRDWIQG